MRLICFQALFFGLLLLLAACINEDIGQDSTQAAASVQAPFEIAAETEAVSISPYLHTDGPWILDGQNRVVILRGPQIIQSSPPYISWHTAADYDRLIEWGFNSIRLGTVWAAIEPEPGQFDDEYLAQLDERIGWARERGIYVILDMHQDLYGEKFNGDGAPAWACLDNGFAYEPWEPWFLNYLQPAVMASFNNLWRNTDGVQDAFVNMWKHIAARYADEPAVAGYDLFNEPFYGSNLPWPPELSFDRRFLQPFYENLIGSMQEADANHLYFFEPTGAAGAGVPCYMEEMNLDNIVYAPHYYSALANVFNFYYGNTWILDLMLNLVEQDARGMNVPYWVGEWALFNGQTINHEQYMEDMCRALDDHLAGWCYWIYNKDDNVGLLDPEGNERAWVLDNVSRTYPQRIHGYPLSFSFDAATDRFEMTWQENRNASGPTVIYVPQPRHYPNGFTVSCSDKPGSWKYQWDAAKSRLLVWSDPDNLLHTLTIERNPTGF